MENGGLHTSECFLAAGQDYRTNVLVLVVFAQSIVELSEEWCG